jgi:biopolymer transport protein ExbB
LGFLVRGGPAMFALLAASIIVIAIVTERFLFFAQQHIDANALVLQLQARIALDDLPGAIAICDQNAGMLPKILKFGLLRGTRSRIDIADALSIEMRKQLGALERHTAIIGTIAVIAPFIGLFGTVLGIIHAFDDIALKGNSSPAVVAAGVSEALITTAAGLFVAVTAVICFNYFKVRAKDATREMLGAADELAAALHYHKVDRLKADETLSPIDHLPTRAVGAA